MSHGGWGTSRRKAITTCHPGAKHYARGLCLPCYRSLPEFKAKRQRYYRANKPQWHKHQELANALRTKQAKLYGMPAEQQEWLLNQQGGTCALCGDLPGRRRLSVDHDHATGLVRAMLCTRCNTALGSFKDSPELCERAAAYLRHHSLRAKTAAA